MLSDAPPSLEDVTTSATCRDSVEVKIFTSSGMRAPAIVPQEIMVASFHHSVVLPLRAGIVKYETTKVITTETIEVIHTSDVNGASKFIVLAFLKRAFAIASLMK